MIGSMLLGAVPLAGALYLEQPAPFDDIWDRTNRPEPDYMPDEKPETDWDPVEKIY